MTHSLRINRRDGQKIYEPQNLLPELNTEANLLFLNIFPHHVWYDFARAHVLCCKHFMRMGWRVYPRANFHIPSNKF